MSNYVESKKTLDKIRNEYGCKGEMIFRTAIQQVVDCGQQNFQDLEWVKEQLEITDKKHDAFDRENKIMFISREFEKAIIECAWEISKINTYDLLVYIQKEVWLSNEGGMDYKRAIDLLKKCIAQIQADEDYDNTETLNVLYGLDFMDDELEELGFEYLLNEEEDD